MILSQTLQEARAPLKVLQGIAPRRPAAPSSPSPISAIGASGSRTFSLDAPLKPKLFP